MQAPVIWSVAGNDSGGGAGLSADQRAAQALGVHLCPVVASVTAQNSMAVTQIESVSESLLDAQLQALKTDIPTRVVKTGLLGSVHAIRAVARCVDELRQHQPLALVVDPVLRASTGAAMADANMVAAYRDELVPRATLITPNQAEARQLCGQADAVPALARTLRQWGAQSVCITGGDVLGGADANRPDEQNIAADWLDTEHAQGWLTRPRLPGVHNHGTGCTFASAAAAALALGFVAADACVLAKMLTSHALRHGYAVGAGAGPVQALMGFAQCADDLPALSWGEHMMPMMPHHVGASQAKPLGLYAIADHFEHLQALLDAGVRTVQLRTKITAEHTDQSVQATQNLRDQIQRSVIACRAVGAQLFINDHWQLALEAQAPGVHLGQEDLLALTAPERAQLMQSVRQGLALGVSTHSLWELCRARVWQPRYVACGPVWPTLTKAMPWQPQGLDNLRWWVQMAGVPVVAIGGILQPNQAQQAAAMGADGVCVVRGLSVASMQNVAQFNAALQQGLAQAQTLRQQVHSPNGVDLPQLPHPTLLMV